MHFPRVKIKDNSKNISNNYSTQQNIFLGLTTHTAQTIFILLNRKCFQMNNLEKAILAKSELLSVLSKVDGQEELKRFITKLNRHFPKGSSVIIVVGAPIKKHYCINMIANHGWSTGWVVAYNQQNLYLVDPIWNGPCDELMIWERFLKNPTSPLRKKFVNYAKLEGLEFGISWKCIVEEKTFVISVKGKFIETDDFSHYIIKSIGSQIIDAANRVVKRHPEIITLDKKEYQAISSMVQNQNDVDAAENSGMTLDAYRYTIKEIQKRFAAKNRYDMNKKVYCLP